MPIPGSSFMVGRALTSLFWGVVADRYGRKPIILIGTFSVSEFSHLLPRKLVKINIMKPFIMNDLLSWVSCFRVVFNALFGLSTNFWMALSMRFLLGCFNSLLGTIRVCVVPVCMQFWTTYLQKMALMDYCLIFIGICFRSV